MCELDEEQNTVLKLLLEGKNVFLNGEGGTGKSHIIRAFLEQTEKNVVCLAPTGFAALNLPEAMTIHSFFKFPVNKIILNPVEVTCNQQLAELLRYVDCIVIDEISMVRAEVFQAIDISLRMNCGIDIPFSGKQIVVVGDFLQLPPVVPDPVIDSVLGEHFGGCFAFLAPAWSMAKFVNCSLTRIHRQNDPEYIRFLQMIRTQQPGIMDFLKNNPIPVTDAPHDEVTLCCRRNDAEEINTVEMNKLDTLGFLCRGEVSGFFMEYDLPTPKMLLLKLGAKVMIISNGRHKNCRLDRCYEYVNGEIGTIVAYNPEREEIQLKMSDERLVTVRKAVWTNTEYALDYDENGKKIIVSREIGCFKQYPILPAWATSIHKAQGQTLDCNVHIHLGNNDCFASGQLYTALSRVRSFRNVTLNRPIRYGDIIADRLILTFLEQTFPLQYPRQ